MTDRQNTISNDHQKKTGGQNGPPDDFFADPQKLPKLWELAFNATPDMIFILDVRHQIISVNDAMAKVLECSPQQAIGQKCWKLVHHTDRPPVNCPHQALLEDGLSHEGEIYEERLNIWLNVSVIPLSAENGDLVGSIHVARDVTAQKRSQQAFRESEERYHHLSESALEGVVLSEESTIMKSNQVLADMLGYRLKEMIGTSISEYAAPHDQRRLADLLKKRTTGPMALDCIGKDGTTFPIEARTRAITYKGKMVYQTTIRDLTEQKRIVQERIAHARMRGVLEMAGAVSHEINQPLMALQGYLDIVAAKLKPSRSTSKYMNLVNEQLVRIKTLTHKMMNITRYETKDYAGGQKIIDLDQAAPENTSTPTISQRQTPKNTNETET